MGPPAAGSVVLVHFPFSDLTSTKLRPAVVIAEVEHGDRTLCQVTSRAYADSKAVTLEATDFLAGSLRLTSYARPGKLFTAHETLVVSEVGMLTDEAIAEIVSAIVDLITASLPS